MPGTVVPLVAGASLGAVVVAITLGGSPGQDAAPTSATTLESSRSFGGEISSESGFEAGLQALSIFDSPQSRRDAALALIAASSHDESILRRISVELPSLEAIHFELAAIAALAEDDPAEAIAAALALDDFAGRREALRRIATTLVMRDPREAMAAAATIGDFALQSSYRANALGAWAGLDPSGLFDYLETASPDAIPNDPGMLALIGAADWQRLLATARSFPPALRQSAETAALAELGARDPLEAYARAHALGGEQRDARMHAIARAHAGQNPAAALAYLDSVSAGDRQSVIDGIADVDLLGVVDHLLAEYALLGGDDRSPVSDMYNLVFARIATGSVDAGAVLGRLDALGDASLQSTYDNILGQWGQYHAEDALQFALANPARIPEGAYRSIARGLGATNPALAMETLARLPENLRGPWIISAGAGMARSDMAGALDWVSQYRGQPYFDFAVESIIRAVADPLRGSAPGQPRAAAEFLDGASASLRADVIPTVAAAWARQDPAAAADWVMNADLGPGAEARRSNAIRNVTTFWTRRDAGEALRWAAGLPEGAHRDTALGMALAAAATTGSIDRRLLESFSSDAARQEAVPGIASGLAAGSNPGLARELIDIYLTDPERRSQAEAAIERGGLGGGAVGPGGGIGIMN